MIIDFAKELNKRRIPSYMTYVSKWIQDYVSHNFGKCIAIDDLPELASRYPDVYKSLKKDEQCLNDIKNCGFALVWKNNIFKSVPAESTELCVIIVVDLFLNDLAVVPEYIDELSVLDVGKYCEAKLEYLTSFYKDACAHQTQKKLTETHTSDNKLQQCAPDKRMVKVDLIESICEYLADIFNTYKQIQEARHV